MSIFFAKHIIILVNSMVTSGNCVLEQNGIQTFVETGYIEAKHFILWLGKNHENLGK